jgi:tRNA pseudouridine38-40 synthase
MPAYRVVVAYDGTDFAGWQAQGRGAARTRTVQGVLEAALARLAGGERVAVAGAGRTDAGVHALGQTVSFQIQREMPPPTLQRALNALLPEDVRIVSAAWVPPEFHARRSARGKLYRYVLDSGGEPLPTRRRLAAHVPVGLDEPRVVEAAALFLGRQDFASLASTGSSARTSVRTVTRSEARFLDTPDASAGRTLLYEVEADGFLRRMVRSMVGGLLAVGRGALDVDGLRRALAARDRRLWPPPAPARGLTLVRVDYDALE